jgi:putative endonuclease
MRGFMYIFQCSDNSFYTGSTIDLEARLIQHENGEGVKYTNSCLPVKLMYYKEYDRIDEAYYQEKQIQGWSRKKKLALIEGNEEKLSKISKNYTQFGKSK